MENVQTYSEKTILLIIIAIASFFPLVGMGVDLIAPSLPAISTGLHVSHTVAKNLISLYLLGYAVGCFLFGAIADGFGRKKILTSGLLAFSAASLLPVFFPHPFILLLTRFLQGVLIGSFAIVARTVLADILLPERLVRTAIILGTMWGIGPIIGPLIGGYLQFYYGWQACFIFFAALGFLALITIVCVIPETLPEVKPLNLQVMKNNFLTIFRHRMFMGIILLMGCAYSLLIVFNTLGPFLIQASLGYSPIYFGHVALWMGEYPSEA